jgi:hypothetical protein
VSERAITGETLRPPDGLTPVLTQKDYIAPTNEPMRVLSINYCVGDDDDMTTLIMELRPSSMMKIYELFRIVNVIHLNITEMTREEFAALEPMENSQ